MQLHKLFLLDQIRIFPRPKHHLKSLNSQQNIQSKTRNTTTAATEDPK